MSDQQPIATPRTDAEEIFIPNHEGQGVGYTKSKFARILERELIGVEKHSNARWRELQSERDKLSQLCLVRDQDRAQAVLLKDVAEKDRDWFKDELAKVREERDKLREALSISRGQWYHSVNRDQCLEALNHSKSKR